MSIPCFWWVDLPMKAYDEQMVEEKKLKRWGASWVHQSKEIRCGWFTLYKQKTNWSPGGRKNGNKFTVFSGSSLSQKVSRPLCLKKKMKRQLWLIVFKCIISFEVFKIFLSNGNWGLRNFSYMFLKSRLIIGEKRKGNQVQ